MPDFDLGFLGGGQLARMSIQAAQRMGLKCLSLDPGTDTPASQVAPSIVGSLDEPEKIAELARSCERLTLENEFIPAEALRIGLTRAGRDSGAIMPGIDSLALIQDKLLQRQALAKFGVASPKAIAIELEQPEQAVEAIGFPMVLKARFGGYDGKGTRYARDRAELDGHRSLWGKGGWMAEEFVDFRRELAVMAFVNPECSGAFPTVETIQSNHVCDLVFPCDADASDIAIDAVKSVGGQGLFGVELFQTRTGEIVVNEIAPRPHNSGHYTLDWGGASQFEQHVRIASGLPLTNPVGGECCMANLLGIDGPFDFRAALSAALKHEGVFVHWYGKPAMRAGRKMGHLNAVGKDCRRRAVSAREAFFAAGSGRLID